MASIRRSLFVNASILCAVMVLWGGEVAAGPLEAPPQKTRPPRFSPPANGRPGYLNDVEYYRMPDPRVAARLLLEEAALAQVDIDRPGQEMPWTTINVMSGPFEPEEEDQLFAPNAPASGDTICLIKMSRLPSIRELAEMMSDGVRVFRGIQYGTFIARVPFASLGRLYQNSLVVWVGVFKPSHKLPDDEFTKDQTTSVCSLAGDEAGFRRDLERLGASVQNYHESIGQGWALYVYTVQVDPVQVPEIAKLWWVEHLSPDGQIQTR